MSYWLDTIGKGACISVFNCFKNTKSLVNYYVESCNCVIDMIDVKDLEQLGEEMLALYDRLDLIKLKIQNKLVNDIDYFKFPK